jgi:hypothetical protein
MCGELGVATNIEVEAIEEFQTLCIFKEKRINNVMIVRDSSIIIGAFVMVRDP